MARKDDVMIFCEMKGLLHGYEYELECWPVILVTGLYKGTGIMPRNKLPIIEAIGALCIVVPVDTVV